MFAATCEPGSVGGAGGPARVVRGERGRGRREHAEHDSARCGDPKRTPGRLSASSRLPPTTPARHHPIGECSRSVVRWPRAARGFWPISPGRALRAPDGRRHDHGASTGRGRRYQRMVRALLSCQVWPSGGPGDRRVPGRRLDRHVLVARRDRERAGRSPSARPGAAASRCRRPGSGRRGRRRRSWCRPSSVDRPGTRPGMLTERIPRYSPGHEARVRVRALDEGVQALGRGLVLDVDPDRDLAAVRDRPVLERGLDRQELVELVAGPVLDARGAASPAAAGPRPRRPPSPAAARASTTRPARGGPGPRAGGPRRALATSQPFGVELVDDRPGDVARPLAAGRGRRLPRVRVARVRPRSPGTTGAGSPGPRCPW